MNKDALYINLEDLSKFIDNEMKNKYSSGLSGLKERF
jgi:hypothetical protein